MHLIFENKPLCSIIVWSSYQIFSSKHVCWTNIRRKRCLKASHVTIDLIDMAIHEFMWVEVRLFACGQHSDFIWFWRRLFTLIKNLNDLFSKNNQEITLDEELGADPKKSSVELDSTLENWPIRQAKIGHMTDLTVNSSLKSNFILEFVYRIGSKCWFFKKIKFWHNKDWS